MKNINQFLSTVFFAALAVISATQLQAQGGIPLHLDSAFVQQGDTLLPSVYGVYEMELDTNYTFISKTTGKPTSLNRLGIFIDGEEMVYQSFFRSTKVNIPAGEGYSTLMLVTPKDSLQVVIPASPVSIRVKPKLFLNP